MPQTNSKNVSCRKLLHVAVHLVSGLCRATVGITWPRFEMVGSLRFKVIALVIFVGIGDILSKTFAGGRSCISQQLQHLFGNVLHSNYDKNLSITYRVLILWLRKKSRNLEAEKLIVKRLKNLKICSEWKICCNWGFCIPMQPATGTSGAARNFVQESPVTWRASDCSFRLFSNSWNWHKAPA